MMEYNSWPARAPQAPSFRTGSLPSGRQEGAQYKGRSSYPGEKRSAFYDPELIGQFTKWIRRFFREDAVIEVNLAINDPQFGRLACEYLYHLMKRHPG